MAVVQDNNNVGNIYHSVLQWAGQQTMNDSVLFDEYVFKHDVNPENANSFSVHPADSIECPIFVIDSESEDDHKILVFEDRNLGADMFHKVNV